MTIDQILTDVYAIDPSLTAHDAELRVIVKDLLAARPDARPDAAFVARLRKEVTSKAAAPATSFSGSLRDLFAFRLPLPAGTAIALLVIVAVAATIPGMRPAPSPVGDVTRQTGGRELSIADLGEGAFGSIAATGAAGAPSARTQSGGGGGMGTNAVTPQMPMADGATAIDESGMKMIAPTEYVNYAFVYDGELPTLESEMSVYRRVRGFGASLGPAVGFYGAVSGLIDLNRLENATLQSFAVSEDKQFGLTAFVEAIEGTVQLNQNWRLWPHPENECRDEACYARYRLTPDQVPADDAIIAVADRFLSDYGIDRGTYGAPEVRDNGYRLLYATTADKSQLYTPESMSVVYPQLLDGKVVTDESGATAGLMIGVNIRHMRVEGAYGLTGRSYERSGYVVETDSARIMKFVRQGGIWGNYVDPSVKTVEIALGAPDVVFLRTYRTSTDGYSSDELFVPAWRFPVMNPPADQPWFRTSVVIPIIKETLDAAEQNMNGVPMPLTVPGRDGGGTSGSIAPTTVTPPEPAVDPAR